MELSFGKINGVCLDCIYLYSYTINQCGHTICLNCLYTAIDEKIELKKPAFVCPRCINQNECTSRPKFASNKKTTNRKNKELVKQPSKPQPEKLHNQKSQPAVYEDDSNQDDSCWPNGTESWLIHEIKPQREIFAKRTLTDQSIKIQSTKNWNECSSQQIPENDSFWPDGTESWHIHEIKPQRQIFSKNICKTSVLNGQCSSAECLSENYEKPSYFETNEFNPKMICDINEDAKKQPSNIKELYDNQVTPQRTICHSIVGTFELSSTVPLNNEKQYRRSELSKTADTRPKSKLGRKKTKKEQKRKLNIISIALNASHGLLSSIHLHKYFLSILLSYLTHFSLFMCLILMRLGLANNFQHSFINNPPTLLFKINSSTRMNRIFKNITTEKWTNSSLCTETIKILRDLETLLFYGIT